jgi:ribose transport system ATP-binding protein
MMQPVLAVQQIHKSFPGVHALKGVDARLMHGEVLALLGENGAGKSTLMKILAGLQSADSGDIFLEGKKVTLGSASAAISYGIALIHQELNLAENLDAAANVFLGREPVTLGFVNRRAMHERAQLLLDRLGFALPSSTLVADLSPGKKQLVEIAKALATNARILIMDEPTSSLTQSETDLLFEVIGSLRKEGVSVIYISHRLHEIKRIADRVTVLRDGENAGELTNEQITHDAMVRLMVGREMSDHYQHRSGDIGEEVFSVVGLRTLRHPREALSFSLRRGEIIGLAGLVGAGRTELMAAISGVDRNAGGEMKINGELYQPRTPRDGITRGIALIPEDRKDHGLVLDFSVGDNLTLPSLVDQSRMSLFRNAKKEAELTSEQTQSLHIKASHPGQQARLLSGGNQQKIVIGKWLAKNPSLLLLDEPTRGIDVGAKREIYQLMESLATAGKCVFFASSDLEEILGIADRVIVMHEGRIAGELLREELSEQAIMNLATGMEAVHH